MQSVCLIIEKRVIVFAPFIFFARKPQNNTDIVKNNHFLEIQSRDWPTAADQRQGIGSRCLEPEKMANLGSDGRPLLPQTDFIFFCLIGRSSVSGFSAYHIWNSTSLPSCPRFKVTLVEMKPLAFQLQGVICNHWNEGKLHIFTYKLKRPDWVTEDVGTWWR